MCAADPDAISARTSPAFSQETSRTGLVAKEPSSCPGPAGTFGPRGCPGPRGPVGPTGPQPPLSDAVDSTSRDTAASSLAVKTVYQRTREVLSEDLILYVREDGNDAGDGRSEATAKASLKAALKTLAHIDPADNKVVVRLGEGNFTWPLVELYGYDPENLSVVGAGVENTVIEGTASPGSCTLAEMRFTGTLQPRATDSLRFFYDQEHRTIRFCSGGLSTSGHVDARDAVLEFQGTWEASAAALHFAWGGRMICNDNTVFRAVDRPAFYIFAQAARQGAIAFYKAQFEGEATGMRYNVYQGGQISGHGVNISLETLLGDRTGQCSPQGACMAVNGLPAARAMVTAAGGLVAGERVDQVERTGTGTYRFTFAHSLPSRNYYGLGVGMDTDEAVILTMGPERTRESCTVHCTKDGRPANCAFAMSFHPF